MTTWYLGEILEDQEHSDELGVRTYSHRHRLYALKTDTAYAVMSSTFLPQTGAIHKQDLLARAGKRSVVSVHEIENPGGYVAFPKVNHKSLTSWVVQVEYSTQVTIYENPLLEPAEIWYTGEQYQRPASVDRDLNVITNTAGTPVLDLTVEQTRPIINVRKNVSPTAVVNLETLPDVLNDGAITVNGRTYATNIVKYKFIGMSDVKYRNGVAYLEYDFQLHLRADKWKLDVPNAGLYQINPDSPGQPWPTFDATGTQATQPMPLALDGTQLASNDPADFITLDKDYYAEVNMTSLLGSYWS